MTNDNSVVHHRTGRKVRSLVAALSALFAPPVTVSQANPSVRLLGDIPTVASSMAADEKSVRRPAPLLLKRSSAAASAMLVGHGSHSSHSSHSSHASGSYVRSHSSHASHHSGSGRAAPGLSARAIAPAVGGPSRANSRLGASAPIQPQIDETEIPADIDFNDPLQRFQIKSFSRISGTVYAIILDLQTKERFNVSEGSKVEEYTVDYVDMAKKTVQLRRPDKSTLLLKRNKS